MPGMRLITSTTSPYGRMPRMVIKEHGLDVGIEDAMPWKSRENITPHNPIGKIPILILDDGTPVLDSWVITEHLDSLGDRPLLPSSGLGRVKMQSTCALCHDILGVAVIVVSPRLLEDPLSDNLTTFFLDKAEAGLKELEARLGRGEFGNEELNMADVCAVSALGFFPFRLNEDRDWRAIAPKLFGWYDDMLKDRPSAGETAPAAA